MIQALQFVDIMLGWIDSQMVEDGCYQVSRRDRFIGHKGCVGVGGTVHLPTSYATTGEERGKRAGPMISPRFLRVTALAELSHVWSPPEFTDCHHQGCLQ